MHACRRGTGNRSCRQRPSEQAGRQSVALPDHVEEDDSSDSGREEGLPETAQQQPDQAQQHAQDPGHFLARFNCAAAIGIDDTQEPTGARSGSRLKRYDFAVEACLGPGAFHRSKVGLCMPRCQQVHIASVQASRSGQLYARSY